MSDFLFHKDVGSEEKRYKREDYDSYPLSWDDNSWEIPFDDQNTDIDWSNSPLNPIKQLTTKKILRQKGNIIFFSFINSYFIFTFNIN